MTLRQRRAVWRRRKHLADTRIARLNRRIATRVARLRARPALAAYLAREFGLTFTSGWRSKQHNDEVGGVPNSWHTRGTRTNPKAIDLVGARKEDALNWARNHVPGLAEAMIHDVGSGLHLHLAGEGVAAWRMPNTGQLSKWRNRRAAQKMRSRAAATRIAALKRKEAAARIPTRLDAGGIEDLVRHEGEVLYAYNDPAGHATFGVGHLLHRGRVTSADEVRYGSKAHPKDAPAMRRLSRELLARDAQRFERAVVRFVPERWRRSHDRFDALVSISFNLGEGVLTAEPPLTSLGVALKGDSVAAICDAILLYDKAGSPPRALPGLTARRRHEADLFRRDK